MTFREVVELVASNNVIVWIGLLCAASVMAATWVAVRWFAIPCGIAAYFAYMIGVALGAYRVLHRRKNGNS